MSIAKRSNPVEGHTGSGSSQTTGAFATNPVSGDTIVVFVAEGGIGAHNAPTDSTGVNTYTQIGTTQDTGGTFHTTMSVWRSENITGGSSFTVTGSISGTHAITVIAWCLSGAKTPTSYNADTVGAVNVGSANPASGTSTPAPTANSFFIAGACTENGNNACTAGSGWEFVTGSTQTDDTSFQDLYTEELTGTNTSSSAQNGQFTASSTAWAARVASFAPVAGAAVTPVGRIPQMFHPGRGIFRQARHRSTIPGINFGTGPVAYSLVVDSGVYDFTGSIVNLRAARNISAAVGSYNVTGSTAGLQRKYTISAVAGTYTITGQTVSLRATRTISINSGTYSITGSTVGLRSARNVSAISGSYTINGTATNLKADRKVSASAGSYIINGTNVGLRAARIIAAAAGSYVINGTDVTLTHGIPAHAYTLIADSGSYSVTGTAVGLVATRKMVAASGSYIVVGSPARADLNLNSFPPSTIGGGTPQIIND